MCTVKLFGHIMGPCSVQTAGFPYNIHRCGSRKVIDFRIPVAQTAHLVTTTKPATKASPKRLSGCCPTPHPTWRMQLELLYTMPTKNTQTVAPHLHTAAHAQATQGGDDPQLLWWVYVTKPLQGEVQTCTGRSSAVMLARATRPAKKASCTSRATTSCTRCGLGVDMSES